MKKNFFNKILPLWSNKLLRSGENYFHVLAIFYASLSEIKNEIKNPTQSRELERLQLRIVYIRKNPDDLKGRLALNKVITAVSQVLNSEPSLNSPSLPRSSTLRNQSVSSSSPSRSSFDSLPPITSPTSPPLTNQSVSSSFSSPSRSSLDSLRPIASPTFAPLTSRLVSSSSSSSLSRSSLDSLRPTASPTPPPLAKQLILSPSSSSSRSSFDSLLPLNSATSPVPRNRLILSSSSSSSFSLSRSSLNSPLALSILTSPRSSVASSSSPSLSLRFSLDSSSPLTSSSPPHSTPTILLSRASMDSPLPLTFFASPDRLTPSSSLRRMTLSISRKSKLNSISPTPPDQSSSFLSSEPSLGSLVPIPLTLPDDRATSASLSSSLSSSSIPKLDSLLPIPFALPDGRATPSSSSSLSSSSLSSEPNLGSLVPIPLTLPDDRATSASLSSSLSSSSIPNLDSLLPLPFALPDGRATPSSSLSSSFLSSEPSLGSLVPIPLTLPDGRATPSSSLSSSSLSSEPSLGSLVPIPFALPDGRATPSSSSSSSLSSEPSLGSLVPIPFALPDGRATSSSSSSSPLSPEPSLGSLVPIPLTLPNDRATPSSSSLSSSSLPSDPSLTPPTSPHQPVASSSFRPSRFSLNPRERKWAQLGLDNLPTLYLLDFQSELAPPSPLLESIEADFAFFEEQILSLKNPTIKFSTQLIGTRVIGNYFNLDNPYEREIDRVEQMLKLKNPNKLPKRISGSRLASLPEAEAVDLNTFPYVTKLTFDRCLIFEGNSLHRLTFSKFPRLQEIEFKECAFEFADVFSLMEEIIDNNEYDNLDGFTITFNNCVGRNGLISIPTQFKKNIRKKHPLVTFKSNVETKCCIL